jgi:hypothetical protein
MARGVGLPVHISNGTIREVKYTVHADFEAEEPFVLDLCPPTGTSWSWTMTDPIGPPNGISGSPHFRCSLGAVTALRVGLLGPRSCIECIFKFAGFIIVAVSTIGRIILPYLLTIYL